MKRKPWLGGRRRATGGAIAGADAGSAGGTAAVAYVAGGDDSA